MTIVRSGRLAFVLLAGLTGSAGAARAQDAGTYDAPFGHARELEIRPLPLLPEGVITPDEFWSDDYRRGQVFKSLIAPEQMNAERRFQYRCKRTGDICGF